MNCPICQTSNREEANYCKHCGNILFRSCPRCHNELLESVIFCDNCGLRLMDPPGFSWWAQDQAITSRMSSNVEQAPLTDFQSPARMTSSFHRTDIDQKANIQTRTAQAAQEKSGNSLLQQYIPKELLEKIEAARASGSMAGERRVVTMLFCDVQGSTAAAEQLDPEEWSDIINGAFEHMIKPIYKYEGNVARLMGDALLAFFGAPIAHEDDPQRAVLAGLDIVAAIKPYRQQVKQRYGIDFDVRVGINTGLVVVGAVGSDLRMEYTALGDAINLASRMEQTAIPGTVQISQDTYKLVKPLFDFEELGSIEVKGKAEPVLTYRVVGRKVLTKRVRGIEGLYAEMVGREAEMETLRGVMTDLKQGIGRIVCVLGEAGLGKSRLANETYEIFKQLTGSEENWYETTSLSYETHQAYGLLQRLIRRVMGIAYDDSPIIIREKLTSLVDRLDEEQRPRATLLLDALFGLDSDNGGPPIEGDTFKQELIELIEAWWRSAFSSQPTVLVFDDMHWSDAASIELLVQLLPLTGEIPLVLLCALRSERQAPAWLIRTTADEEFRYRYTEISLQPLSDAESNELVNRLLANPVLPDNLRASILEKAAGNPFFIEEVVRTLIDRGLLVSEERTVEGERQRYWRATSEGGDFDLPDNLQSLLASRIDRLEEATRATLQIAAVIGRSFYRRVLQAVDESKPDLDRRLSTLLRLDMIREATRVPEIEYAFRNPLTQEAVYQTILLKRRREFHRRVGEAMEAIYPDRLEGLLGLLAYHFALAGQTDKAIAYSREASRQAVALYAYDDAIRNLLAAFELIEPGEQSETHLELLEELADVYRMLRDFEGAIDHYQRALDLWANLETADKIVEIRLNRKIVQMVADLKWSVGVEFLQQANESRLASRANLEQGLPNLEAEPANMETVRVLVALSTDAWRTQDPPDWEAAQRFAQSAVDMAKQLDSPVDLSRALGALATVLDGRSLLRQHLQITQQRLDICQQPLFDDARETIAALRGTGTALMYVSEYQKALPYLQEAESMAVETHMVDQQATMLGLQAQCYFRLDRWDEVLGIEEKWRDLERRYTRERVGET